MTFAASLARLTTNATAEFAEQVENKIAAYAAEDVEKLKNACQEKALQGYATHSVTYERSVSDLWKKDIYSSQGLAAQALKTSLQTCLGALGFSSLTVRIERLEWSPFLDWQDWSNVEHNSHKQTVRLSISVSWAGQGSEQDPQAPESTAAGSSLPCPICFETKPAVALVPCGHTACHGCGRILANKPCPCCRRHVTGLTNGLFIG
jgi:hypothetical protein